MTFVDLRAGPGVTYPRRLSLRRDELDLLGRLSDLEVPTLGASRAVDESRVASRLGVPRAAAVPPRAEVDVCAALHAQALVDSTDVRRASVVDELGTALRVLHAPEVDVALDLAVARPRRAVLHAVHRLRGGVLAGLATVDGDHHELGWSASSLWPAELQRVATVSTPSGGDTSPPGSVDLPYELFLGGTAAVREHRDDLLARLVAMHSGALLVDHEPVDDLVAADVLRWLETDAVARLRAMPTGPSGAGLVSWLGFPDGWRSLLPVSGAEQLVRIRRRDPADLAADVARVLAEVLGSRTADEEGVEA